MKKEAEQSTSLPSILFGLAILAGLMGVDALGGFIPLEQKSIDWRLKLAPRPFTPMTSDIVHVDIDDGAIDSVGRWPWSRSVMRDVIVELRQGGARTVAIDLIFSEREEAPDGETSKAAHLQPDTLLAEAIATIPTVVAVTVIGAASRDAVESPFQSELSTFGPDWRTPEGAAALERLLDVLGADIEISVDAAATAARLDGARLERFASRPLEFKKSAAWRELKRMDPPPASFEEFARRIAPGSGDLHLELAESKILELVWDQHQSWGAVQKFLVQGSSAGTLYDRAPVPELARAASMVGFVTADAQIDTDGTVRWILPTLPTHGGSALQFGLAAAALHRGIPASQVRISENTLHVGPNQLPLHEGKLWLDWPTATGYPAWYLLRQHPDEPLTTGHVSIGALVGLAKMRRSQARNETNFQTATRAILGLEADAVIDDRILADAASEVDFVLEGEELESDTAADRAHRHNCQLWLAASSATAEGRERLQELERDVRNSVEDKLVMIGWIATGANADFVSTAIQPETPGIVVHAVVADMVLTGRCLKFPPVSRWLLLLTIGVACIMLAVKLNEIVSLSLVIILLLAYTGAFGVWWFAKYDVIYPLAAPLITGFGTWLGTASWQAVLVQRARTRITRQFRSRVSAQLVDHLIAHPDALSVGGQEREATVLFCDIAGFTTISEQLGSDVIVKILNRYLSALTEVLVRRNAFVSKFLGDGMMAFWSAFVPDPKQATSSCLAALECQEAMERVNRDPRHAEYPDLRLRVGITTGIVIAGDCGAPPELNDYTVIGDSVNLASRLESAGKALGANILINGRTRELLDDPMVRTRFVGNITVVGQSIPVPIYEVLTANVPAESVELSERAINAFCALRFEESAALWRDHIHRFGESKLAALYLSAIEEGIDTDGALRLRHK